MLVILFLRRTLLMGGNPRLEPYISNIGLYPRHFSTSRRDRNKIPTATPNFDDGHSNGTTGETARCNQWKNQDGGLKTSNTYTLACTHDGKQIPTAMTMFFGSSYSGKVPRPNGKKPEVESPRWRPLNFKYVYLDQHIYRIATKFQRL